MAHYRKIKNTLPLDSKYITDVHGILHKHVTRKSGHVMKLRYIPASLISKVLLSYHNSTFYICYKLVYLLPLEPVIKLKKKISIDPISLFSLHVYPIIFTCRVDTFNVPICISFVCFFVVVVISS